MARLESEFVALHSVTNCGGTAQAISDQLDCLAIPPTDLKRTAHRASVPSERFGDTVVVAPLQPLGGQAGSGSSLRSAKRVDLRG